MWFALYRLVQFTFHVPELGSKYGLFFKQLGSTACNSGLKLIRVPCLLCLLSL